MQKERRGWSINEERGKKKVTGGERKGGKVKKVEEEKMRG